MSTEKTTTRRPYRKRRRAELEQQTRQRITEAAVELHGSVGPARTTISAVADRAGVQRATVYRHFPDEDALFAACSGLYLSLNPPPDPTPWAEIGDHGGRLRTALAHQYAWYRRNEAMFTNVRRDEPLVAALRPSMTAMRDRQEALADLLAKGRPERGARRRRVRAAIGHAVAFETWRSLARDQGLPDREAAELMAELVAVAGL